MPMLQSGLVLPRSHGLENEHLAVMHGCGGILRSGQVLIAHPVITMHCLDRKRNVPRPQREATLVGHRGDGAAVGIYRGYGHG